MEKIGIVAECIAAIALLWQIVVLLRQTRIFKHHATSQKLIGDVLKEQAKIMERQVNISEDAGRFTRRMAVKEEREKLFDSTQSMKEKVLAVIETTRVITLTEDRIPLDPAWERMANYSITCQKELTICTNLPNDLKDFFIHYAVEAAAIAAKRTQQPNLQQIQANAKQLIDLNARHPQYDQKMIDMVRTPIDV